jgi:hypothetical protein
MGCLLALQITCCIKGQCVSSVINFAELDFCQHWTNMKGSSGWKTINSWFESHEYSTRVSRSRDKYQFQYILLCIEVINV